MFHIDPALPFDDRVRLLTTNAELLLYRGLCLAGLFCKEPLALTTRQMELLAYGMEQPDGYGNFEIVARSDVDRYVSELVTAGLLDRVDGATGLLVFAEDVAEFCNATQANAEAKPKQPESKPQKQIDAELSKKRREAGRKGGSKRKQHGGRATTGDRRRIERRCGLNALKKRRGPQCRCTEARAHTGLLSLSTPEKQ